jgi:hypothetical protein
MEAVVGEHTEQRSTKYINKILQLSFKDQFITRTHMKYS